MTFAGTPTLSDLGDWNISLLATDGKSEPASISFRLLVFPNSAPLVAEITPDDAYVDEEWKSPVFRCFDPDGDTLTITWNATDSKEVLPRLIRYCH